MPSTRLLKPKPAEAPGRPADRPEDRPEDKAPGAGRGPRPRAAPRSRASSCARGPQRDRCEGPPAPGALGPRTTCGRRRARSASAAPRTTWAKTHPEPRGPAGSGRPPAGKSQEPDPDLRQSRRPGAEPKSVYQSHRAFTVIPPNPKKRKEMQRKAEAELAALEELRLSRAMAYVSINPSSVGGCMSLEEVRMKQQQEMMEAKRNMKPVKAPVMEKTPVLSS